MAFWDDFSKKVTQVSQDAVSKTKSMTDTAKYRSQISDEQRKIAETYRRIGELCYSMRREQEPPEIQALISEIDASQASIKELNRLIQVAKGVVLCPNCGAELNVDAAFCVKCGTRIAAPEMDPPVSASPEPAVPEQETPEPVAAEPAMSELEATEPASESVTPDQGRPEEAPATTVSEDETAPVQEEAAAGPEPRKMRFCTRCGAALEEYQRFCTMCGNPV